MPTIKAETLDEHQEMLAMGLYVSKNFESDLDKLQVYIQYFEEVKISIDVLRVTLKGIL